VSSKILLMILKFSSSSNVSSSLMRVTIFPGGNVVLPEKVPVSHSPLVGFIVNTIISKSSSISSLWALGEIVKYTFSNRAGPIPLFLIETDICFPGIRS